MLSTPATQVLLVANLAAQGGASRASVESFRVKFSERKLLLFPERSSCRSYEHSIHSILEAFAQQLFLLGKVSSLASKRVASRFNESALDEIPSCSGLSDSGVTGFTWVHVCLHASPVFFSKRCLPKSLSARRRVLQSSHLSQMIQSLEVHRFC